MPIDEQPMNVYWSGQKSSTSNKYKINYKGTVATASALPATDNKKGDTYNISEDGSDYIWTGTEWDKFGANVYIGATDTTNGIQGLVPSAEISERNKFFRGDGTYKDISWNMITNKPEPPVPVGAVFYFAMNQAPVNYLICDGSAVSRATYSDLFTAIGTTYGTGDGSTTFNLPNLIGKFAEGANSNIGDSVAAGLPNITGNTGTQLKIRTNLGQGTSEYGTGSIRVNNVASSATNFQNTDSGYGAASAIFNFDASNSNSIYGNSDTVQPPAVKLLPCIRALS